MNSEHIISIGSLQIPTTWLILTFGLIVATFIVNNISIKRNWEKEKWLDLVITLLLTFLVVYKFGWIIFDLKRVIDNPKLIFWVSGSSMTFALLITILIGFYKVKKNKYPVYDVLDFFFITIMITYFIYSLLVLDYGKTTNIFFAISLNNGSEYLYHPVNWYRAIFLGILILIRFKIWSYINIERLAKLYLFFGIGLFILTIFDQTLNLYYGFTYEQWLFMLIIILSTLTIIKYNDKQKNAK